MPQCPPPAARRPGLHRRTTSCASSASCLPSSTPAPTTPRRACTRLVQCLHGSAGLQRRRVCAIRHVCRQGIRHRPRGRLPVPRRRGQLPTHVRPDREVHLRRGQRPDAVLLHVRRSARQQPEGGLAEGPDQERAPLYVSEGMPRGRRGAFLPLTACRVASY